MSDLDKRTLTIERTLNAPIHLVWEAWTSPEHIARWWGPKGMDVRIVKHEFKPGGAWKYTMLMPDGNEFVTEGIYSRIEEPNRIVTSADFRPMTEGVTLDITFEDLGEQTKFTFKVIHISEEYRNQQAEMGFFNGWGSTFDRLEEMLSTHA